MVQKHKDLAPLFGQFAVHTPFCLCGSEQTGGLPKLQGPIGAVPLAHRIRPLGGLGRTCRGTHNRGDALHSQTKVIGTLCLFHPNDHVHRLYCDHSQLHRFYPMFLWRRLGRIGLDGTSYF